MRAAGMAMEVPVIYLKDGSRSPPWKGQWMKPARLGWNPYRSTTFLMLYVALISSLVMAITAQQLYNSPPGILLLAEQEPAAILAFKCA